MQKQSFMCSSVAWISECISTDQPDKDQCSEHQRSADQRLSTSTKIGWSIEQNAI